MNIKEACRYSNFLNGKIGEFMSILLDKDYYTKSLKTHRFSEATAIPDREEEVVAQKIFGIDGVKAEHIVQLTEGLILEKIKLSSYIEKAKYDNKLEVIIDGAGIVSIDSGIEYNKHMRLLGQYTQRLTKFQPKETESMGRAYAFNVEGNQTPYQYPVTLKTEADFNREEVVTIEKHINATADAISTEIEKANLLDVIDYSPQYTVHDTCEEILIQFMGKDKV